MKNVFILLTFIFSFNSFAYTQCAAWDNQKNECAQEVTLVDMESFESLFNEVTKQGEALIQNEKRLKLEMVKLIAEARKQIVLDLLNDPEMREVIKEKIRNLEAK